MRFDEINLITKLQEDAEIIPNAFTVPAEAKEPTRSEFYAAYAVGLSAKYVFVINPDDYKDACLFDVDNVRIYPSSVTYEGEELNILRTYVKDKFTMELVCG